MAKSKVNIVKDRQVFIRYLPNKGKSEEAKHYNYLATVLHCDFLRDQYKKNNDDKGLELFEKLFKCDHCTVTGRRDTVNIEEAEALVKKGYADYDIFGNRGPEYRLYL